MNNLILRFLDDENGNGAIEYAMVLLIILTTVGLLSSSVKIQISTLITNIGTKLTSAVNTIS